MVLKSSGFLWFKGFLEVLMGSYGFLGVFRDLRDYEGLCRVAQVY